MRLEWTDREVVFIADVGTVGPGIEFDIEDSRGQDLVTRGVARLIVPVQPAKPAKKEMIEKRDIHVVVTDNVGVGDQK
jgi:hypothetical protein